MMLTATQIQLIFQIIINRIALLMDDPYQIKRLKWGIFGLVLFVTSSVTIIWIPASLQISEAWEELNSVWDRMKQVILLMIDLVLNGYFLYSVRSRLIANGLTKYQSLFKINAFMVFIAIALDVMSPLLYLLLLDAYPDFVHF
jgi:hypothetical protein